MVSIDDFTEGLRAILEGSTGMTLRKVNTLRERQGLPPLDSLPDVITPLIAEPITPALLKGPLAPARKDSGVSSINPTRPRRSPLRASPTLLGDRVAQALARIGVTETRVSKWLGRPCGCSGRRRKLNQLDAWARRLLEAPAESQREVTEDLEDLIG